MYFNATVASLLKVCRKMNLSYVGKPGRWAQVALLLLAQRAGQAVQPPVLPSGGHFVAGSGSISSGGSVTTINQSSLRGIIDWNSFSIGPNELVKFNNSGATLNRVTGGAMSSILGSLTATGTIYLLNPEGILIGPSGVIRTGGDFVASTLHVPTSSFMAGKSLLFEGTSNAAIRNLGKVASSDGSVFLIAPTVLNEGSIAAPKGSVGLAAGQRVLLQDSTSDGRIFVEAGGNGLTNAGLITATEAELRTAGGNIYALAGNNSGLIRASGATYKNGHVWLTGNGDIMVSGTIQAANIDGSGGTIKIGNWSSRSVTIDRGAVLDASASSTGGTGGSISVLGKMTTFAGTAKATGGSAAGNGGNVETSGHTLSVVGGAVDASAANGQSGSWLLDPDDLTIDSALANTLETALNGGTNATAQTTVSGTSGNGDITVANDVRWSGAGSLTLSAYRNIALDAAINASGAGAGVVLRADNAGNGTGTIAVAGGSLSVGPSGSVKLYFDAASNPAGSGVNGLSFGTIQDYAGHVTLGPGATLGQYALINSVSDLQNIKNNLSGSYALGRDIDATATAGWNSGAGFLPIGQDGAAFTGILDGDGHAIKQLVVNRPSTNFVGLLGSVGPGGIVRNIALSNTSISGSEDVGGLAGWNAGKIEHAFSSGTVFGVNYVGGLVGANNGGGLVTLSQSTGTVEGSYLLGGLVGFNDSGAAIAQSYSTAAVSGGSGEYVGGLVGWQYAGGSISQCYSTGTVTGNAYVGGLVGNSGGIIEQSYSTGPVSGAEDLGGLVGGNSGSIDQSFSTGPVSGDLGSAFIGGLINQSYSTSPVSGGGFIGGLVGVNYPGGAIEESYSAGLVLGNWSVGGLVGVNYGSVSAHSLWDRDTSGQTVGASFDSIVLVPDQQGVRTTDLQTALHPGFDNVAWAIVPGQSYPYLRWRYPNGVQVLSGTVMTSAAAGSAVAAMTNGTSLGQLTAGANGYYYLALDPNSIADGGGALTYLAGANPANTIGTLSSARGSDGTVSSYASGLALRPGTVDLVTGASNLSTALPALAASLGSAAGPDFLYTVSSGAVSVKSGIDFRLDATGNKFSIDEPLQLADKVSLVSNGRVGETETGEITAAQLLLRGSGSYELNNAHNDIHTLAGENLSEVDVATGGDLAIGTIEGVPGITATGNVTVASTGNLTISSGAAVASSANGSTIDLATDESFTNRAGSDGITTHNGHWLIWSKAPDRDTLGGLTYNFRQYNATRGITSVQGAGNGVMYTLAPVLNVGLSGTVNKTYDGTTAASLSPENYVLISGSAIEGDTLSFASRMANYDDQNAGTGKTVTVNGLSVSAANGNVTVYGYQVNSSVSSGIGSISPATLTVRVHDSTRPYGQPNPVFGVSYIGFAPGDTSSSLSGSLLFDTLASQQTVPGDYSIIASGLKSRNYRLTYLPGTLTITPLTDIRLTIDDVVRLTGQPNPPFSAKYLDHVIPSIDASSLLANLTIRTDAKLDSRAGIYPIFASGQFEQYWVTSEPGRLTVIDSSPRTLPAQVPTQANPWLPTLPTVTTATTTSTSSPGTFDVVYDLSKPWRALSLSGKYHVHPLAESSFFLTQPGSNYELRRSYPSDTHSR